MPVPASIAALRLPHLLLCLLVLATGASAPAATRPPDARIPLEALGYVAFSAPVLSSGFSILTLNYVDDRHMLVTFNVRRLLKRIPDDPPDDVDRSIDAVLIEIPSGNILARTSWRLHDPAQYLWPLADGHFLLRVRDRLTTIAPLVELKSGDAFKEHPFLSSPRPVGAVLLSPDSSLLVLESLDHLAEPQPERSPSPGTRAYAAAQTAAQTAAEKPPESKTPVEIHFYRIRSKPDGVLYAQASGTVRARSLVSIPADGSGFVSVLDEGRQHWAFNYNLYRGKVQELSPFESTCHPSPFLVSRSEFIAFGCRSGNQRQMFGGFNLRGEEMWEQIIPETYVGASFAFAPAAGRFAFGRVNIPIGLTEAAAISLDQSTAQIVTVHQTDTGKQLLRLDCTPIIRAGQNFDLSPDGSALALIRGQAIEIYRLPPLSARDRAGIAKAASLAPELTDGPILLTAPLSNASARAATTAGTPVATPATDPASRRPSTIVDSSTVVTAPVSETAEPPAPAPQKETQAAKQPETQTDTHASTQPQTPAATPAAQVENGDADTQATTPRKPPTLYAPGEHPSPSKDKAAPK